ncbi:MAG TPA: metallophosphoesterase [Cerasibacillus sp.]|uniref:metallophosphoesterase family protein n=1 Tax=Cerasibacillus sp. TaxID=2498711 RepID=UPI002F3FBCFF
MRLLITSDSHGLTKELSDMKQRHHVDWMIHCGDSELSMDAKEMDGFVKVRGNCDYDNRLKHDITVTKNDFTFFITHGHLYHVKRDLMTLSYRAEEENAQIICFGHTHIAGAEKINNQIFINPGSIRLPRRRIEPTYALLRIVNNKRVKVTFYSLNGEEVSGLSDEFIL